MYVLSLWLWWSWVMVEVITPPLVQDLLQLRLLLHKVVVQMTLRPLPLHTCILQLLTWRLDTSLNLS